MPVVNTTPPVFSEQTINRFWKRVDKTPGQGPKGECWRWTGRLLTVGYGSFGIQKNWKTRQFYTHRVSLFLSTGKWPTLFVCHECDWRPCCNPAHLFEGTQATNLLDMANKGTRKGEKQSMSKLTESQVLEIRAIYAQGNRTPQSIGEQFGVARRTISHVVNRTRWGHI